MYKQTVSICYLETDTGISVPYNFLELVCDSSLLQKTIIEL